MLYHFWCEDFLMGTLSSGLIRYQVISMHIATIITRNSNKVGIWTLHSHNCTRYQFLFPSPGVFYSNWLIQNQTFAPWGATHPCIILKQPVSFLHAFVNWVSPMRGVSWVLSSKTVMQESCLLWCGVCFCSGRGH